MINGSKRVVPLKHKFGCPLSSMSVTSNYDNYDVDTANLKPIEQYSKVNTEALKSRSGRNEICTCFYSDQNLQTQIRIQMDYADGSIPLELPVISKVYDFNPDDPASDNCFIDIQTYKRIIGLLDHSKNNTNKNSKETKENFNDYDTDYGIFKNNTRTVNGFYKSQGLNQIRKSERMPMFTDSFSFDKNLFVVAENPSPRKESPVPVETTTEEVNEKSAVLLIKASDYKCKDNKLITHAFYPKKVLKAIRKEKSPIKEKTKSPRKENSVESPETDLKIRRMRIYDDAIAMLQSIRAIPVSNNIRLRAASKESPTRAQKTNILNSGASSINKSPNKENKDLADMLSPNNSENNEGQLMNKKYEVVIKTTVIGGQL